MDPREGLKMFKLLGIQMVVTELYPEADWTVGPPLIQL